jgi:hypothetical protein
VPCSDDDASTAVPGIATTKYWKRKVKNHLLAIDYTAIHVYNCPISNNRSFYELSNSVLNFIIVILSPCTISRDFTSLGSWSLAVFYDFASMNSNDVV